MTKRFTTIFCLLAVLLTLFAFWSVAQEVITVHTGAKPWLWGSGSAPAPWVPPLTNDLRIWYAFANDTNTSGAFTNCATPPTYTNIVNWDLYDAGAGQTPLYNTPVASKYGYLSFDGADDFGQTTFQSVSGLGDMLGSTNRLVVTGCRTISFWIRPQATNATLYYTISANDVQVSPAIHEEFRYGGTYSDASWTRQSAGLVGFNRQYGNGADSVYVYGTNKWIHLVYVSSYTDGLYDIYTNGVYSTVSGDTNGTFFSWNYKIQVGSRVTDSAWDYKGDFGQLMGWATNLSPADILDVYNNQKAGF